MPAAPPVALSISVSQRDIARISKRLSKWQGAPLRTRLQKAIQGGLALLVPAIRVGAARHTITGATSRSVKIKKLRNRPGEIWAYSVGPRTWYAHFVIGGTSRGVEADPYVGAAADALGGEVSAYMDAQVRRLA